MAQILAIHEEADSLALIRRFLIGSGNHVVSFHSVREAARWMKDHQPDLVVVSGGRHGEKAREAVRILNEAGVSGFRILLLMSPDSLDSTRDDLRRQVRSIMEEAIDYEELLKVVNSALVQPKHD